MESFEKLEAICHGLHNAEDSAQREELEELFKSFGNVLKNASSFLTRATSDDYCIGLKILNKLVFTMGQPEKWLPPMQKPRVIYNFMEEELLYVFQMALTSMHQFKNEGGSQLQELSLALSAKCLYYNFFETSIDERSGDFGTVQIPSSWRLVLEDPSTLQIFFDYYAIGTTSISKEALKCLVQLASVRISLFRDDAAYSKFSAQIMTGTKEILQTGLGLVDFEHYLEYCRLLGSFRVNYQLSELLNVEGFGFWIQLVGEFTLKSLHSLKWASSCVYYLLQLWSRLVRATQNLEGDVPSLLDEFVPQIAEGFIVSGLNSIEAGILDDFSNYLLDDVELLHNQLDCLPYLCRFQYGKSGLFIIKIMESILDAFMESQGLCESSDVNVVVIETKLAWIVHIIASVLNVNLSTGCREELQEVPEAKISAHVFQLIRLMDHGSHILRYGEPSRERLDRAILTFIQHFKKSHQLYASVSRLLELDHSALLDLIVTKLVTNLRCYTKRQGVIDHTLNLFLDYTSSTLTRPLLLDLDTIKSMLADHAKHPFLKEFSRCRTKYYHVVGQLIFADDSPVEFKFSMEPFMPVIHCLQCDSVLWSEEFKCSFIWLMRDLRGIMMAANSCRAYELFFYWLFPCVPLLLKGLLHWADSPEVTTPCLKFVGEVVWKKDQHLDLNSPINIHLFREVCKLVVAYGTKNLNTTNIHDYDYKGIRICLTIVTRALEANYVPIWVFAFYNDGALLRLLKISQKLIMSIPMDDIFALRNWKLKRAYFSFLDVMFSRCIFYMLHVNQRTFSYIIRSLDYGLRDIEMDISLLCASTVDNLATYYFNNITITETPSCTAAYKLKSLIENSDKLFSELLHTLLQIVLSEDCCNIYKFSRPMLSLILTKPQLVSILESRARISQPGERLSTCLAMLMEGIKANLSLKNRGRFFKNLNAFRIEFHRMCNT